MTYLARGRWLGAALATGLLVATGAATVVLRTSDAQALESGSR